ncbi:hypothetical protein C4K88_01065 [Arthrobacter pityocampae]|uniref:Uncharacterized protein n=1 Tax=Arthrobacter pityocampae TaxID=547334 RepID=A0A2S5J142_9MICC|nr:P22 phage major capsid protein family protein [Arthrobacter pityocampae]PPB50517.1 hypothetical protein C4K88_01065 [Arthrobacter pityocampae]
MANIFALHGDKLAATAATLVGKDLVLAELVRRDLNNDWGRGSGDTVYVRVPGAVAAKERALYDTRTPLDHDELVEQTIPVTLSTHAYSSIPLSLGSLSLDLEDFAAQVLVPQADAIVKFSERALAAAMQATPEDATIAYDPANPAATFSQMRRRLRNNGVSSDVPLLAVVGSGVYADLLDSNAVDENGRVRGFAVTESTRLQDSEIIAFVRDAFVLAVRAPEAPQGASYAASVKAGGFALLHVASFDGNVAVDRSLVSAFVGAQGMPLAVDLEDGTVELRPHAGAVRVLTDTATV